MFWDLLLSLILITFALTGWATGISKKWYAVPTSVIVATFMCQHIYVDAATFMSETLHLEPFISILMAYLILWILIQQFVESILSHYRAGPTEKRGLVLLDKLSGSAVAFSKVLLGFIFATMVAFSQTKVPFPEEIDWRDRWLAGAVRQSHVVSLLNELAEKTHPVIGKYVLSDAAPRINPQLIDKFMQDPFQDLESSEKQHGKDVYRNYKNFKSTEGEALDKLNNL